MNRCLGPDRRRSTAPAGACALLVAASFTPSLRGEAVDCSFGVPINRPLLCQRKLKLDIDLEVDGGAGTFTHPLHMLSDYVFVDETLSLDEGKERSVRTFVKSEETFNGEALDPPYAGLEVEYRSDSEAVEWEIRGTRHLAEPFVTRVGRSVSSTSLWVGLPEAAEAGEEYETDFALLVPAFVSDDLEVDSAPGTVELESFEDGIATLKVRMKVVQEGVVSGIESKVVQAFVGRLRVIPAEGRIAELKLRGKVRMEGKGPVRMSGEGEVLVDLSTKIGDAASSARRRKPTFRDNLHRCQPAGVQLELPSYYHKTDGGVERGHGYFRSLDSDHGRAALIVFAIDAPGEPNAVLEATEKQLRAAYGKVSATTVRSPLGSGRAYLFAYDDENIGKGVMRLEYFPHGADRMIVLKLSGSSAKAVRSALNDLASARKTLRPMTPPPSPPEEG